MSAALAGAPDLLADLENELAPLTTVAKVVKATGLSLSTINRALARGDLKCTRIGRAVRIPRSEVRAWLARGLEG